MSFTDFLGPTGSSTSTAALPEMARPAAPSASPARSPIDDLVPRSEQHKVVLEKLLARLGASEDKMSQFHTRWQVNERRFMAYINHTDMERLMNRNNKTGEPPSIVSITVPYAYATAWTIVTYLTHTFCGRKPMFQVGAYSKESVRPSQLMETMLQFNADHTKLVRRIFQWMMDGQIYGLGVVRTLWNIETRTKNRFVSGPPLGALAPTLLPGMELMQAQNETVYEGNEVTSIDPFMFFPDPRVPMEEVNKRGEYVFWRTYEGIHTLKKAQSKGQLKWIEAIGKPTAADKGQSAGGSVRNLLTSGDAHPGLDRTGRETELYHQLDQGTVDLVPKEWGLSESEDVERWLFTIVNRTQIVQAEPFDYDHSRHPVSVIEPNTTGYSFGQLAILDMLGPIQDILSWLVNSRMQNVRTAVNNIIVYDPNYVEAQDLKNPGPGKLIRLKPTAMGRDIKSVIQQLQVQDVTQNHIADMQNFMRLGDILSATNDNLRGVQEAGGRKTATEVRTAGESGASRLAAQARLVSAQGVTDLAEQMSLNIQQFQTMEFFLRILGEGEMMTPVPIRPEDLQGNFYYPVHDGTLPLDRVAMLEIWKEIWLAVSGNPQLAQMYNAVAIFEYVAELGGAKNLSAFKVQLGSPEQMAAMGGTPVGLPGIEGAAARQAPPTGAGPSAIGAPVVGRGAPGGANGRGGPSA